ncbi:MAG: hypothetical protein H8E60_11100 [Candidatus Marinimicrobia bacterium]|nr:hypothetical protein [Candidatus Neomarinimicrobiota bacterium]
MKSKLIIHTPEKIGEEIDDFKLDSFEDGNNFTSSRIKLTRDIDTDTPTLWYSQELIRNHKCPTDEFGSRQILKPFTSSNMEASVDETLTNKFKDTVLGFKKTVSDYAPLTDINSNSMKLFIDEDTAQFMDDVGVNIEGLDDDFTEMESVSASAFMEDVSKDATKIKEELSFIESRFEKIKESIAYEFEKYQNPHNMSEIEFTQRMTQENIPQKYIQEYLSLNEQLKQLKHKLGIVEREVYSETSRFIKLPQYIEEKTDGIF